MADTPVFPTSYNDPTYAAADQAASASVGIPPGWLTNIRTKGEKSNADQVSSAGARTPYQITPSTRQSIMDQTGVDPWLSPSTAAYGAAYLLKQNLDHNGGNPILATANYIGGTDPSNWGPKTMAYVKRVTGASPNNPTATPSFMQGQASTGGAQGANPYQLQAAPDTSNLGAGMPNANAPSLSKVFDAYRSGQMDPQSAAEFEQDVNAGKILLPQGMKLNPTDTGTQAPGTIIQTGANGQDIGETPLQGQAPALAGAQPTAPMVPQSAAQVMQIPAGAVTAYNNGTMPPDVRAQMQSDIQGGRAQLPQGATLTDPNAPPQSQGFGGDLVRQVGLAARDAIQGIGNTAGIAYDPIAATLNTVGGFVGHDPQIAPLGAQASNLANRLGLPQPVGSLERGVNAAAQGVAEAGTFAGAGGAAAEVPGIVGQLGKTFGADAGKQAAAMAAGQAAAQHAADAGYSPGAQAAINIGTMALTLGGASAMEGLAGNTSPAVAAMAQRLYGATKAEAQESAAGLGRVEPTMQAEPPQTPAARGAAPGAGGEAPTEAQPAAVAPAAAEPTPPGAPTSAPSAAPAPAVEPIENASTQSIPQTAPPPEATAASTAMVPASTQEFMPASELATQTRKAVGVEGAPFGLGKNTARDVLATQAAPDPDVVAAADRLGITDMLDPDHLTTNQSYRELAQAIKSNPGSLAKQAEMENLQGIGLRAQQMIEKAGGTTDLSELSSEVKNQHQAIIDGLGDTAEGLYGDVNKAIPAGTQAPAPNTLAFINQRLEDLGGNVRNLTDGEQRLLSRLTPQEVPMKINGQIVDPKSLGMEPQLQQPTYALLDNERQHIGMALDGQISPFSKAPVPLLKKLYGELAQDQEQVADDMGVGNTYRTATATVAMRKSYEDDMTKLYGRQLSDSIVGKLDTAMKSLSTGDESKLINLIRAVPENLRSRVVTSGLQSAFGKATEQKPLNFKSFADWMDGVKKNSGAFNALMANLPADSRRQFLDLAKVSRSIANSLKENITTGRVMAAREDLGAVPDGVMSKVLEKAKEAAVGVGVAGAAHAAGPIGAGLGHAIVSALSHGKTNVMKAADELLVSPEFTQLAKAGGAPTPVQIKAVANSGPMRRFYNLAKDAAAPNDSGTRERWLTGVINSMQPTPNTNRQ